MFSVADLTFIRSVAKLKLLILALASGVTRLRNESLILAGRTGVEDKDGIDAVVLVGDGGSGELPAGIGVETGGMGSTAVVAVRSWVCATGAGGSSMD